MTTVPGFRPDINGLRALAILTVMAFHFGLPGMRGGFGGVDVFYVISGYLMMGIAAGRLERGTFTLTGFWIDRTLRIVPALLVFLVAMLALGTLLVPVEYGVLGQNLGKAALFASNLRLRIDYFGPEIDQEWLLHTWSLSLEWQFYLAFPLFAWALWRLGGRKALLAATALAALASLALSLWLTRAWPIVAFYMLPARAWELLGGGVVWLAPGVPERTARAAQLGGLALILAGAMSASEHGWPGWQALLPVAGTMLAIAAARTGSVLTGNAAMGWIGRNSYSIYLWHWPAALLVRRTHPGEPLWIALGIAASFALGHLSWRLVEPLPRRFARRGRLALALIAGLGLVAGAGYAVARSHGWSTRFDAAVGAVETLANQPQPARPGCFSVVGEVPPRCVTGGGPLAVTLIGDSHADSALAGVRAALPAGRALAFNAYAGCMPVLGAGSSDPRSRCGQFNAALLAPLTRPRSAPVLLAANWQAYFDDASMIPDGASGPDPAELERRFVATACALTRAGPAFALLPVPGFARRLPAELQARLIAGRSDPVTVPLAEARQGQARALAMLDHAAARCGLGLIEPATVLCPGGLCRGSEGGTPLYYDRGHLSVTGSRRLAPLYAPLFGEQAR